LNKGRQSDAFASAHPVSECILQRHTHCDPQRSLGEWYLPLGMMRKFLWHVSWHLGGWEVLSDIVEFVIFAQVFVRPLSFQRLLSLTGIEWDRNAFYLFMTSFSFQFFDIKIDEPNRKE
jgi:hypothetical protein